MQWNYRYEGWRFRGLGNSTTLNKYIIKMPSLLTHEIGKLSVEFLAVHKDASIDLSFNTVEKREILFYVLTK